MTGYILCLMPYDGNGDTNLWYGVKGVKEIVAPSASDDDDRWAYDYEARPLTYCPSGVDVDTTLTSAASYGAPNPNSDEALADFADYKCEVYVPGANGGIWVKISRAPTSSYVLLVDSAYGPYFESSENPAVGNQASNFYRTWGDWSGLIGRHNGVGNIAYGDGHVADSNDLNALYEQSHIRYILHDGGYSLYNIAEGDYE